MTLEYCPLWNSYRRLFPRLGCSVRAALLAVSSRVLKYWIVPWYHESCAHGRGQQVVVKVLYPTWYPGSGNCPRDFCCLCKNIEFVQIKREGKERKLSEFIFAGACLYKTKMSQCCQSGLNLQARVLERVSVSARGELTPVFRAVVTQQAESDCPAKLRGRNVCTNQSCKECEKSCSLFPQVSIHNSEHDALSRWKPRS